MKNTLLLIVYLFCGSSIIAQNADTTMAKQPETFEMEWGDTTRVMQKYFVVFLKKGPNRGQSDEEEAEIQKRHLAYLSDLYVKGKTSLTGPFDDDGDILGIVVFNTATAEEAKRLAEGDPAVKAGRLVVEVHPWWSVKGSVLK